MHDKQTKLLESMTILQCMFMMEPGVRRTATVHVRSNGPRLKDNKTPVETRGPRHEP